MSTSDSDSCASSVDSTLDCISRSTSNSSATSVASQEHPIVLEWAKWEDRLFEDVPPPPEDLFDNSVDYATRQARQKAYQAKVDAAMKDVLEEYKKWWADNDEAICAYWVFIALDYSVISDG
ncbi:uncharacterized protein EV420DRAFT_1646711 [Desarmillaria tabescens]|uniref:Uncharacterized protein n=1 Tax=Armillaria tabescens TaxID=1929756 RepID=A0AA39MWZ6_ARMTA|nr:uncharacterized protein EV420DRAFT_1646711 [Desarmillaria tabescens]KAK0449717.1 hypothetical protein EV420DRAFT_1646711 [Desarmillaria tabescens]